MHSKRRLGTIVVVVAVVAAATFTRERVYSSTASVIVLTETNQALFNQSALVGVRQGGNGFSLVSTPFQRPGPCVPGPGVACLGPDNRFGIIADWRTRQGVTGTAAPIFDSAGDVQGALIVAAPSSRLQDRLDELARLVREEAAAISRSLGYRP